MIHPYHNKTRNLIVLVVCFLLALNSVRAQPKLRQASPDILLPDVTGAVQKLSAHLGKVVLVDFWASWCVPCRRTNPILVKLYAKYKQKGFEIYSISIDEDKAAWKKAIIADKMTWTHVIENAGWDGPVATAWKIEQVPSSFLLDKSGKLVAINPGTLTLEHKIIEQLKK